MGVYIRVVLAMGRGLGGGGDGEELGALAGRMVNGR